MKAYVNGRLVDEEKATVSIMDRGFLYGDGIFETIKVRDGRPLFWDRHMSRLREAASLLGLPVEDEARLKDAVMSVVATGEADNLIVRITVTRGPNRGTVFMTDPVKATVVVAGREAPVTDAFWLDEGWSVTIAGTLRGGLFAGRGTVKTTSYLSSVLAMEYARLVGADEAVMLNEHGEVTEGSRTNLFAVVGGVLKTPALECGVLPGVTREVIMELADDLCGGCEEAKLKPRDLSRADEIFMTGTTYGVAAVRVFDGERVADGKPGTLTRIIYHAYQTLMSS